MQRDKVHRTSNATLGHLANELLAVDTQPLQIQAQDIEVPGMNITGMTLDGHLQDRVIGKSGIISMPNSFAPHLKSLRLGKLLQADGGSNVGEIVLVTGGNHFVVPRWLGRGITIPHITADAMQAHKSNTFGQSRVVSGNHASLAGGDSLGCIEAEYAGMADRAYHAPTPFAVMHTTTDHTGRESVGSILNDRKPIRFGQLHNNVHFASLTGEMDRRNGLELGAMFAPQLDNALFKFGYIDIEGVLLDIDKYWMASQIARHLGGRGEGPSGGQHQVVLSDACRFHRQMQSTRCGVDGQGMAGPPRPRKSPLQGLCLWARSPP